MLGASPSLNHTLILGGLAWGVRLTIQTVKAESVIAYYNAQLLGFVIARKGVWVP